MYLTFKIIKMDLGTALIGLLSIIICALPFVLSSRSTKKKEKELKAKTAKTVIKEIRFGPNTDDHDFDFKVKHAIKFLEDGDKIKAYVQFKGRAIVFKDRGELILLRFLKELEELGAAEELPKLEGKRMIVMISPKKKKVQ